MTVSLLPPPCPKRLWSSAAQRVSSSMAITFLAFSMSFAVSAPLPGPISSTVSVGLMSALSMMAWHRQGRGRRVSARRQQQARRPSAVHMARAAAGAAGTWMMSGLHKKCWPRLLVLCSIVTMRAGARAGFSAFGIA